MFFANISLTPNYIYLYIFSCLKVIFEGLFCQLNLISISKNTQTFSVKEGWGKVMSGRLFIHRQVLALYIATVHLITGVSCAYM